MNGKGSAPRPMPDRATFEQNFDNIFRKDKAETTSSSEDSPKEETKDEKDIDSKV